MLPVGPIPPTSRVDAAAAMGGSPGGCGGGGEPSPSCIAVRDVALVMTVMSRVDLHGCHRLG